MFDLFLYPPILNKDRSQTALTASAAPRRAERHRSGDLFVALLSSADGSAHPNASKLFSQLSEIYFKTPGTVTTAVRAALEQLNETLLSSSGPVLILNLVVLHNQLVYIAHCGATNSLLLSNTGVETFSDSTGAGQGLGLVRGVTPRFFQSEIKPDSWLLLCKNLPAVFSLNTIAGSRPDYASLNQRLITQGVSQAALINVKDGKGQIKTGSIEGGVEGLIPVPAKADVASRPVGPAVPAAPIPSTSPEPAVPAADISADSKNTAASNPPSSLLRRVFPGAAASDRSGEEVVESSKEKPPANVDLRDKRGMPGPREITPALIETTTPEPPERDFSAPPRRPAWLRTLGTFFRRTRAARSSAGRSMAKAIPRVLPGSSDTPARMTTGSMLFVSILIPVMVVAASVSVYMRSGASEERTAFLQQARVFATQAGKQKDAVLRRNAWEQTLYWVKKAEDYSQDDESLALRRKAQLALDSMDGIVRLSLMPAFSSTLGNQVQITRMAATASDLYLLDSNRGRVLHMNLVGSSYEYDPSFVCDPGPSAKVIVGPLVGLAPLPPGNENNASVLAVDAAGNLLYCIEGETPLSKTLLPPENNWGKISAMTLNGGNLYVLDLQGNAVWRFDGDNYTFGDRPRLFFGQEVPNLSDVVDMTTYLDDLYLIRGSGKVTVCNFNSINSSATRCTDPASFGTQKGAVEIVPGTSLFQGATTQPPDPSLFLLDRNGPAVYHFSLRLNFQRQLRQDTESEYELPQKPVTAFAISPTRMIFLAFTNQVFYGAIP